MSIRSQVAKLALRAARIALALSCAASVAAAPALGARAGRSSHTAARAADTGVGLRWGAPHAEGSATFAVSPAAAGSASSFDASASVAGLGSITAYHWKFGDGLSADTATAQTTHVYSAAGSYTTTLTETDTTVISFLGLHFTRESVSAPASRTAVVPAPPPPPPVSPRATAPLPAPVPVHVAASPVTLTPHGYAMIVLSCPKTARRGCRGTVTVALATPGRWSHTRHARAIASRCARGCRALGTATYQARAGQKVRIRVHIASFARGLLARQSTLRVRLTVTSVAGRHAASTSAVITLKARRRRPY